MARLIVKSPYIKCGAGQSAGGYLQYIATRERVEIIPDDRPPTNKQEQLIAKLVKDFPDAKELMEYEDYTAHHTKASASALITLTLETNWDKLSSVFSSVIITSPPFRLHLYTTVLAANTTSNLKLFQKNYTTLRLRLLAELLPLHWRLSGVPHCMGRSGGNSI